MKTTTDGFYNEPNGVTVIALERERQILREGYTFEHDDKHKKGEIAEAAACYALTGNKSPFVKGLLRTLWPWGRQWWKPSKDRIRDLAKAGALCAAEIDRLLRLNP